MNPLKCEACGVEFPFYQNKGRPIPRFYSHKCRGHTGFRPGAPLLISEMTSEQKVRGIKSLIADGRSCHSISKNFNVSSTTIKRIRNGSNWSHVTI